MGSLTLYVGVGGAIGAFVRALTCAIFDRFWKNAFPLAVFIINLVGCFFIGLFTECRNWDGFSEELRTSVTVGFCGGLTTWSTFASQTFKLGLKKEYLIAVVNVLVNHIFGFVFCYIGMVIGRTTH